MVEGNHYFPPHDVHHWILEDQRHPPSTCPWKGLASYYSIDIGGERNKDAAWFYPAQPKQAAEEIKDYVAFWRGVEVTN